MKSILALVFSFAAVASAIAADAAGFPPHTIGNSQLRVLPANAAGRKYQLHIGLPASYATEKTKRYPVIYVTDGYWDFEKLSVIRGGLVFDKVAPEYIVVAEGWAVVAELWWYRWVFGTYSWSHVLGVSAIANACSLAAGTLI